MGGHALKLPISTGAGAGEGDFHGSYNATLRRITLSVTFAVCIYTNAWHQCLRREGVRPLRHSQHKKILEQVDHLGHEIFVVSPFLPI